MMQAEDREAADAAFTALVRQALEEADGVVACLDVDCLLAKVKQVAADNHDQVTLALGQLQKELQLVGATLTRAFSAPVQNVGHLAESSPECRLRDNELEELSEAARLRSEDGVREAYPEGYAEASWDLAVLVADATEGSRAAIDLPLRYLRPLIVRYCRARIGQQKQAFAAADDVTQETCLAVLTALPRWQDQSRPFLAFVYGIAAHKVADWHRETRRHQAVEVGKPLVELKPERAPASAEFGARMAQLLGLLPVKHREILVLRVVVGLTAEETADVIGATPAAVRVAQHLALERLRRELSLRQLL
jgi:RNA polymerase sigma-70 factor, ECF subfamily